MVSFFGLKLGGDKKKKSAEPAKPHEWKRIDQNLLGEGQFFGKEPRGGPNGSIRSGYTPSPRPGTSHSTRVGAGPYSHETHNLAASSMYDLSQQGRGIPNLKQTQSDANLRLNFGNESSTSLQLPRPIGGSRPGTPTRPGTADGSARSRPWVNPLDVHFSRPIPSGPKSPLGQAETQAEDGGDSDSLFGDKPENVAQAIINRVNTAELKALPSPTGTIFNRPAIPSPLQSPVLPGPAAMTLPSPPQSVMGGEKVVIRDARANILAGSPSPPLSSPRESANGEADMADSGESRPVVQNVKAKRDTLTVNPNKRQSLSMKIEEFEKSLVREQRQAQQAFDFGLDKEDPEPMAQQPSQERPQQEQRRSPPFVMGNNGPRPESPAGYGPGPREYMNGARPESPAGYGPPPRGYMNGPRPSSPGPRRGPPGGPMGAPRGPPMRSPVERSMGGGPMRPLGGPMSMGGPRGPPPGQARGMPMDGRRPHSPSGMRGPRPESPMGRAPRPHSPSGMRGPRPESPMGRVPRPHSPAGMRGMPGQSPMGRGPRPESPMGRPPRRAPSPRRLRLAESPMGRQPFDGAPAPRSPMGPPPPRAQSPGPGSVRGRRPSSPVIRSPRDESPVDPWPMSDQRTQQSQPQPQPQKSKPPAKPEPSVVKQQAPPAPSHIALDSPTFGAFGAHKTVMLPPRQPSPPQRSDSLGRPTTPASVKPRGFPSNRPPRPSLEEYGVPVARRTGVPAAAVGARRDDAAAPSPVQTTFPSSARFDRSATASPVIKESSWAAIGARHGEAAAPSPIKTTFPSNVRSETASPVIKESSWAAVGARHGQAAAPSPVQTTFPSSARFDRSETASPVAKESPWAAIGARHGQAAAPSPIQTTFPANARIGRAEEESPIINEPPRPAARMNGAVQDAALRFSSDDDDESFFPIQRPSHPPKADASPVKVSAPTTNTSAPGEAQSRPNAASRPRPPPLFDLGLDAPGGLPTPVSSGPGADQDSWPLPSPSTLSPPKSARAPAPAPLNLAVTASEYMDEIGGGPWTPPPGQKDMDDDRGSNRGVATPVERTWESHQDAGKSAGDIGVARGLSVKTGAGGGGLAPRRPDYGLKSPTGIADQHGNRFI